MKCFLQLGYSNFIASLFLSGIVVQPRFSAQRDWFYMKLDAAMILIFILSLTLVGASLFSILHPIPVLSENRYWLILAGYGVLSLGIIFRSR